MAFLSLIWGSSFILIKKALLGFDPIQVGCLRVLISATAFFPFLLYKWRQIDWSKLKFLAIVALCGSGIPSFLYPLAQQSIDSAVAGILNSLTPLFTLILGVIIFKTSFHWKQLWGILIGFAGVSLLLLGGGDSGGADPVSALLVMLACICYAISVNTIKSELGEMNPVIISTVSFTIASPLVLAIFLNTDLNNIDPSSVLFQRSFLAVAVLSLLGTFLATVVFFGMVQRTSALFGSMVAYFIPIVAVGWGMIDNEVIGLQHLAGMAAIFGGVYLAGRK